MPKLDLLKIFISRFNRLGIRYIVTGVMASIIYGKPRLTHDLDLVIDLESFDVGSFTEAFPLQKFYCPPPEIIKIEISRPSAGHFNLIYHATDFKADIYSMGNSSLHQWALDKHKEIIFQGKSVLSHLFPLRPLGKPLRKLRERFYGKNNPDVREYYHKKWPNPISPKRFKISCFFCIPTKSTI